MYLCECVFVCACECVFVCACVSVCVFVCVLVRVRLCVHIRSMWYAVLFVPYELTTGIRHSGHYFQYRVIPKTFLPP